MAKGADNTSERPERSPDDRDGRSGQFLPGNTAAAGNPGPPSSKTPKCPRFLRNQGLVDLWADTYKRAMDPKSTAQERKNAKDQITKWLDIKNRQESSKRDDGASVAAEPEGVHQYDGLPDSICELLEFLGTGLGNIIERAESNLPMSEIETLIAKYARRFAAGQKRTAEAIRIRQAIDQAAAAARKQHGVSDNVEAIEEANAA